MYTPTHHIRTPRSSGNHANVHALKDLSDNLSRLKQCGAAGAGSNPSFESLVPFRNSPILLLVRILLNVDKVLDHQRRTVKRRLLVVAFQQRSDTS
jgi:hypothetical protein